MTGIRLGEVKMAYPTAEQELCLSDTEVGTTAEVTPLSPSPSAIRSPKTGRVAFLFKPFFFSTFCYPFTGL